MIPIIAEKTGANPEAIKKQVSTYEIPPDRAIWFLLRKEADDVSYTSSTARPFLDIMGSLQTSQAWYPTLLLPSLTSSQV
jgi:hypothetical protein